MDRETMLRRLLARAGAVLTPDDPTRADPDAMPPDIRAAADVFADAAIAECAEAARDAYRDGWIDADDYGNWEEQEWDDSQRAMQALYGRSETCKKWGGA